MDVLKIAGVVLSILGCVCGEANKIIRDKKNERLINERIDKIAQQKNVVEDKGQD